MTKIALTASALLIGMGTAFAGSDNYNAANATQPATSIDTAATASIKSSAASAQDAVTFGADRNLFGNR